MTYLWSNKDSQTDERVMRFLAADDVILDRELLLYDVQATVAHIEGLAKIDLLSSEELNDLRNALDDLAREFSKGEFILDERFEDGHSAIEAYLVEKLGPVGEKVHTGRSRNDQVLVATRLYLRDALKQLAQEAQDIAQACLQQAKAYEFTPMPGYTHLQPAVVSSVGTWFAGFAEAFIDNASLAQSTHDWINANPLGTAAGYGVNLPLDREHTRSALGFQRLQLNPVYAQNSRGKFELQALNCLGQALLDVRRYAWDLSIFCSNEFRFVELPEQFTTGSSIMPNKRNPDLVELLRAAYGVVQGASTEIQSVLSLPSGYQRDLQTTKGPLIRAFSRGLEAMSCMPALVHGTQFDAERLSAAIEPTMYATDLAIDHARDGLPFRQAYQKTKNELKTMNAGTPQAAMANKTSAGAAGNLCLPVLESRLQALSD